MSRPQTNSEVESATKSSYLVSIRKLKEPKELWMSSCLEGSNRSSQRTTVKDVTGHTPFSLVYGSKVVLPVEIGIPTTRIAYYSYEENDAEKRVNLDLLPKTRGTHFCVHLHRSKRSLASSTRWSSPNNYNFMTIFSEDSTLLNDDNSKYILIKQIN